MDKEYVQEHILTGWYCRASWRRLANSFMAAHSHFARRSRVIPDTSLLVGLLLPAGSALALRAGQNRYDNYE
jgi:hypothetical protein